MLRVLPHYAPLLFALLMSILSLGACWGPNVMRGAAILTSAFGLAEQPSRAKAVAQSPGTRRLFAETRSLATLRGSPLPAFF
jgi:hypothetical protein